jgi:hypothetical protein
MEGGSYPNANDWERRHLLAWLSSAQLKSPRACNFFFAVVILPLPASTYRAVMARNSSLISGYKASFLATYLLTLFC